MITTKQIGDKGENLAKDFLEENGYVVLCVNYRFKKAEVDVIAENDDFIVFIEVKTRATSRLIEPEKAVDNKKQKLIISAAQNYIEENQFDKEARFDIISILYSKTKHSINHIQDAFYAGS